MIIRSPFPAAPLKCAYVALLILANPAGAAGFVEVTQTIFGMDCAPCAYGVQKNLMKLDGVTSATVSLNDGYARVEFTDDNSVTLEQIRETIRENGFTPTDATLVLVGSLSPIAGRPAVTFADQSFHLAASADGSTILAELDGMTSGTLVRVSGRVDESDRGSMLVSDVEKLE